VCLQVDKKVLQDIPHTKQTATRTAQKQVLSQHIHTREHTHTYTRAQSYATYQVQTWIGNCLDPLEWGWDMTNNKLVPVKTTLHAAPQQI
jgi:hypothetical protein